VAAIPPLEVDDECGAISTKIGGEAGDDDYT
jgi:hypothetical protein